MSFPLIQLLMSQILDNNSLEAAHVMRVCLKIFWSSTQYALPPVTGVDVNFWFHSLATLLSKRLPEASEGLEPAGQPISIEERNDWPWWKVRVSFSYLPFLTSLSLCPDEEVGRAHRDSLHSEVRKPQVLW
jgi:importin-7